MFPLTQLKTRLHGAADCRHVAGLLMHALKSNLNFEEIFMLKVLSLKTSCSKKLRVLKPPPFPNI